MVTDYPTHGNLQIMSAKVIHLVKTDIHHTVQLVTPRSCPASLLANWSACGAYTQRLDLVSPNSPIGLTAWRTSLSYRIVKSFRDAVDLDNLT